MWVAVRGGRVAAWGTRPWLRSRTAPGLAILFTSRRQFSSRIVTTGDCSHLANVGLLGSVFASASYFVFENPHDTLGRCVCHVEAVVLGEPNGDSQRLLEAVPGDHPGDVRVAVR